MNVCVKLMASLRHRLPADAKGAVKLDLPVGSTITTVLDQLSIAHGLVHLIMVNDVMELDRSRPLKDGDDLVIIPPVAGG